MMTTTGSIPMGSTPTYELYLKGSSHGQLKVADRKMLEITGNHITVISRLFQARYSRVSVDTEKGILTYRKRAIEKKVNLQEISQVKKFVKDFFCTNDSDYYWNDSEPESEPKSKDQVDLQEHEKVVPRASSSSAAYYSLPSQTDCHVDKNKKGKRVAQGVLHQSPGLPDSEVDKGPKFQKGHKGRKVQMPESDVSSLKDNTSFPKTASSKK